ncbi:FAD-binding oxidoreductase [Flavimaricola marinus]|uniref:Putative FAD-linked oxidoreductase n=1 Tax=Flavimaricola marinus TaxID=1819565 RepID=A0A238LI19_9RHOB|nr:FAD-binding oxidoreductase [Flavimaricola marinus]SMY09329.1 putative FAD-linked oxidoreductase [Flavimaricola marinus]
MTSGGSASLASVQELETRFLKACVDALGADRFVTGAVDKQPYLTDWTGEFTGDAIAIARPRRTEEVAALVKLCVEYGVQIVPQSGRTGLAGGAIPIGSGPSLVISLERMNAIRSIDSSSRTAVVEAGVILEVLHDAVLKHDLVFPLTFGAKGSCMIGGALATNAGGSNVVKYGTTRELCLGIEAVLPDGSVINGMTGLRKDNTGLDLKDLLVGAEGTLGIITAAVLKLAPRPTARATGFLALGSLDEALDTLNAIQDRTGGAVEAYEYMPQPMLDAICRAFPQTSLPLTGDVGTGILFEVASTRPSDAEMMDEGGTRLESELLAELEAQMENGAVLDAVIASSERQRDDLWRMRESVLESIQHAGPYYTFDLSLPLGRVAEFVAKMDVAAKDLGFAPLVIGHLGDGNLHYALSAAEGVDFHDLSLDAAKAAAFDLLADLHGSFSAEHGIGQSKLGLMDGMKEPAQLAAMRRIKQALDPQNLMNPGKLIPGVEARP